MTLPPSEYLLDFRADPSEFLKEKPIQDMLELEEELQNVRHFDAKDFKLDATLPPDYYKTFQEVVEENGFKFESHEVQTEDGYILTVFRVMNADVAAGKKAPVVFM